MILPQRRSQILMDYPHFERPFHPPGPRSRPKLPRFPLKKGPKKGLFWPPLGGVQKGPFWAVRPTSIFDGITSGSKMVDFWDLAHPPQINQPLIRGPKRALFGPPAWGAKIGLFSGIFRRFQAPEAGPASGA